MNLYTEAKDIAQEALEQANGCYETAQDMLHQICDGHEVAIYYHKAIQFCAEQNTSDGEDWLEDCGGICQEGDSFGTIACRIAFATLYVRSQDALHEMEQEGANNA